MPPQQHGGPFLTPMPPQLPSKNISDMQSLGLFPAASHQSVGAYPAPAQQVQQVNGLYQAQNIQHLSSQAQDKPLEPAVNHTFDPNGQKAVTQNYIENDQSGLELNHNKQMPNGSATANGPVVQTSPSGQAQQKPAKPPSPSSQAA